MKDTFCISWKVRTSYFPWPGKRGYMEDIFCMSWRMRPYFASPEKRGQLEDIFYMSWKKMYFPGLGKRTHGGHSYHVLEKEDIWRAYFPRPGESGHMICYHVPENEGIKRTKEDIWTYFPSPGKGGPIWGYLLSNHPGGTVHNWAQGAPGGVAALGEE